jgi:hypothetical protein
MKRILLISLSLLLLSAPVFAAVKREPRKKREEVKHEKDEKDEKEEKKLTPEEAIDKLSTDYDATAAEIEKKLGKKKDKNEKSKAAYLEVMGNATCDTLQAITKIEYDEGVKKGKEGYNEALHKKALDAKKKIYDAWKGLHEQGLKMAVPPSDGKWAQCEKAEGSLVEAYSVYNVDSPDLKALETDFSSRDVCGYAPKVLGTAVKSAFIEKKTGNYWYSFAANKYVVFWSYLKSPKAQKVDVKLSIGKDDEGLEQTVEKFSLNFEEQPVKDKMKLELREGHNIILVVCKNTGRDTFELGLNIEAKSPLEACFKVH